MEPSETIHVANPYRMRGTVCRTTEEHPLMTEDPLYANCAACKSGLEKYGRKKQQRFVARTARD